MNLKLSKSESRDLNIPAYLLETSILLVIVTNIRWQIVPTRLASWFHQQCWSNITKILYFRNLSISDIGYGGTKKLAKRQAAALVLEQLLDHPALSLSLSEPSSERSFTSSKSSVATKSSVPTKSSIPIPNAKPQAVSQCSPAGAPDCHPVSRIAQIQQSKRGIQTF